LENEIKVLADFFNSVVVMNASSPTFTKRDLPVNFKLCSLIGQTSKVDRISSVFHPVYFKETRKSGVNYFDSYWLGFFAESIFRKKFIEAHCDFNNAIFYSYWNDEWALALALLKREGKIDRFYTRVHGYDLFEERSPLGKIPFREFVLSQVERVYCVSNAGDKYLKEKYPKYSTKYHVFTLGVFDNGFGLVSQNSPYTVISVSNVIPLKRVHLIAEILGASGLNFRWIHFGAGSELENVKLLAKRFPNIIAEFPGHVANHEIIKFYQSNAVSVFLHMSESEGGVPVSIQEAVSFGIPVLASDAGGVAEIVSSVTGELLPLDINIPQAVISLHRILDTYSFNHDKRLRIRREWSENFDAKRKFASFANHIIYG
jgi:glycosyltransferase involved in cell wall biosynthesis